MAILSSSVLAGGIRLKDSCDLFMLVVSNSQIECKYNVVEVDAFSTIAK